MFFRIAPAGVLKRSVRGQGLGLVSLLLFSLLLCWGCATPKVTPFATSPGEAARAGIEPRPPYVFTKGQGVLWAPMTWTLSLYQGQKVSGGEELGDALGELRFRDVQLVLRNTKTQKEVTIPGRALRLTDAQSAEPSQLKGASSNAALSVDDLSRTFAFESLVSLAPGRYALEAIRGVAIDGATDRPQTLSLPLPNPLDAADTTPLVVDVQQGAVSVLGRLAFETLIGIRKGNLSAQTRAENLESGRISAWAILRDLGLDEESSTEGSSPRVPKLIKAHPLVSDLRKRIPVVTMTKGAPEGATLKARGFRVASGVETDCGFEGVLKLVWKADDQTQEYLALVPITAPLADAQRAQGPATSKSAAASEATSDLTPASLECVNGRRMTHFVMDMPAANWLLMATEIIRSTGFVSHSKISALAGTPAPALRRFYGLEDALGFLTSDTGVEQQIRRRFALPLKDLRASAGQVYFAGEIAIGSPSEASTPEASSDPAKTGDAGAAPLEDRKTRKTWEISMRRQYALAPLKEAFGVSRLWNPFSGGPIEAPEKVGKLEAVLQVSADASRTAALAPYVADLRKSLTEAFGKCLQKHEDQDPLVVARASLKFRIKSKQMLATLDSLTIDPKTGTEALVLCFRSEFDQFRFRTGVPTGFQAEMTIEAK